MSPDGCRKVRWILSFLRETPLGIPMGIWPITLIYLWKKATNKSHRSPQRKHPFSSFEHLWWREGNLSLRKGSSSRVSFNDVENKAQAFPPHRDNVIPIKTGRLMSLWVFSWVPLKHHRQVKRSGVGFPKVTQTIDSLLKRKTESPAEQLTHSVI